MQATSQWILILINVLIVGWASRNFTRRVFLSRRDHLLIRRFHIVARGFIGRIGLLVIPKTFGDRLVSLHRK